MIDFLVSIDVWLFRFLNVSIANPVFDRLAPFITDVKNWYLAYFFLLLVLVFKGGKKGIYAAIILAAAVAATDSFAASVLKPFFHRPRPCQELEWARALINCPSGYSFPSNHAANNFAMATALSRYYGEYKFVLYSIAVAVAFSRICVGVHYFSDVAAGAVLGWGLSKLIIFIFRPIENKFEILNR